MWLLRLTAGKPEKIRDGVTLKDPMKIVTAAAWTLFDNLPKGMDPEGGHGVECKEVKSDKEAKAHIAHTKTRIEQEGRAAVEYRKRVLAKMARQTAPEPKPAKAEEKEPEKEPAPGGAASIRAVEGK